MKGSSRNQDNGGLKHFAAHALSGTLVQHLIDSLLEVPAYPTGGKADSFALIAQVVIALAAKAPRARTIRIHHHDSFTVRTREGRRLEHFAARAHGITRRQH